MKWYSIGTTISYKDEVASHFTIRWIVTVFLILMDRVVPTSGTIYGRNRVTPTSDSTYGRGWQYLIYDTYSQTMSPMTILK